MILLFLSLSIIQIGENCRATSEQIIFSRQAILFQLFAALRHVGAKAETLDKAFAKFPEPETFSFRRKCFVFFTWEPAAWVAPKQQRWRKFRLKEECGDSVASDANSAGSLDAAGRNISLESGTKLTLNLSAGV